MTIDEYIEAFSSPENELLSHIARDTYWHCINPRMVSGAVQGRLLSLLSHMIRPHRILELGTFTGYSALCLAEGLQPDGQLITIEHNDELEQRIRQSFSASPYNDRIELLIGDALQLLPTISPGFDLVFIDADKRSYCAYLNALLPLLHSGSWILADNTLWDGHVIDEHYANEPQTLGLKAFNQQVRQNDQLEVVILPLRDGLSIIRVK